MAPRVKLAPIIQQATADGRVTADELKTIVATAKSDGKISETDKTVMTLWPWQTADQSAKDLEDAYTAAGLFYPHPQPELPNREAVARYLDLMVNEEE